MDLTQLLLEHRYYPVNHSSIGSEDHCYCGFRPRDWFEWAHHVQVVAEGIAAVSERRLIGTLSKGDDVNERPWQPVMLNYNYGNPLWGVRRPLGAYLRGELTAQHPKGELTATHDRDEAQRWADDLNNEAQPTSSADTAERRTIGRGANNDR